MSDLLHTVTFLVIPGWNDSGPGHWQTIWEAKHANFHRVYQRDWARPKRDDWLDAIENSVQQAREPVFLVAHSLGCLAVAFWAARWEARRDRSSRVKGALLVAPPWLTLSDNCPAVLADFLPMPTQPLPFPSILVVSENDPYLPLDLAGRLSKAWRSDFLNVGRRGHINIASGHGPWIDGECLLGELVIKAVEIEEIEEYDAVAKR